MFVNPFPFSNGGSQIVGREHAVRFTAQTVNGYKGNPFVLTEDTSLPRETYELQTLVDPGDPEKTREVYHMFPGIYEFQSETYINVPEGHIAWIVADPDVFEAGCNVSSSIFKAGYKGLITGQLAVSGGEMFLQPGMVIGELIMAKAELQE